MRAISVELAADLASGRAPLVPILRVWLKDGADLAFSGCDRDLVVDGVTYTAGVSADASDVESTSTLEVANLELEGMMVSPSITKADLRAGVWDNAKMMLAVVNAEHTDHGMLQMQVGWIGEVTLDGSKFRAVFNGLKVAYKTGIIEVTSPNCRAALGDARCKIDLDGSSPVWKVTGTVGSIDTDDVTIHDAARTEPPHPSGQAYFIGGKLTWLTGDNAGLSMEIREATTGVLELGLPMPYAVLAGDTYELTPGCPKAKADCIGTFSNIVNFRGEPDAPGNDLMLQQGRVS